MRLEVRVSQMTYHLNNETQRLVIEKSVLLEKDCLVWTMHQSQELKKNTLQLENAPKKNVLRLPEIGNLDEPHCFCGQLKIMLHFLGRILGQQFMTSSFTEVWWCNKTIIQSTDVIPTEEKIKKMFSWVLSLSQLWCCGMNERKLCY